MGEGVTKAKTSVAKRAALLYRNFNAVAAVALCGTGLYVPVFAPVLNAGAGQVAYKAAKKKRSKKQHAG